MSTTTPTAARSNAVPAQRRVILDHSGNPISTGNGRPTSQQTKREPVKPIDEVRVGRIKAAIWQNIVDAGNGESFVKYGVTFERLYLNRDGQWRGTGSFGKDDLLLLAKVAEQAFARIHEIQLERPL